VTGVTRDGAMRCEPRRMMIPLQTLATRLTQAELFLIGIGIAGLAAHLGGPLIAGGFNIDELIPSAAIFFGVAAVLEWIGNKL
jgi:hypothetical protein